MSVEMNESYYRCLAELRTRYKGRGVAENMRNQNELLEKKQAQDYVLLESKST